MSAPSPQILVSDTILQWKETGVLGKMDYFRTGVINIQDALGASESKKVLKISNYNGGMSKGHRGQLKELPMTKAETVWATK